ncbi:MAG TPA: 50S ribosomal protein L1 [Kiritimatiellia bacterium]|jgi:large subunit ribosomal protein L1|nr:50S ribosomal protein L1 [Kiritimatiellia bacterium]OQC60604.1 MAG: 50S ribosomal protein L1 [Verrucomicrobia bacterium ADurb.Bin018]MBP9571966.1 50S ribosomal protein L1 [Kiritimatiellia bacterium]HOE01385.1 50S ribosomal protein L1 [Kiritimatiellia bacterium]HOE36444.1 50S ribosomal protein L1 [Kiritimatiellia bacterium]
MAFHGKKYKKVAAKVDRETLYTIEGALKFLKDNPTTKFDATAEIAFRLGVDPTKSDQAVRSTVTLPFGTGKTVRVLVFASGPAAEAAREAGAEYVGFEDMIAKVTGGFTDFDVAVATPDAMKEVRKLGKVLGPRGLMPNPKTGTVSDDTAAAVKACKAGRVEFRMDRHGNVMVPFGKMSFDLPALVGNCKAVIDGLNAARPAAAKGIFIKRATITSTMGPGLRLDPRETA